MELIIMENCNKRNIFLTLLFVSFGNYFYSQIKTDGFSFKAGYSLSAQSAGMFEPVAYYRHDIDFFYLGVDYEKRFKYMKNSTVIFGLDFTKKGYRADVIYNYHDAINTSIHYKWMYSLYYAELPIIIRTSIGKVINLSYGVAPAFLFYNHYDFFHSYNSDLQSAQSSISKTYGYNYLRGYDLQLCLGLSKDITSRFTIEANVRRGFFNQNKQFMGEVGIQNLFMFGVRYNFKKLKTNNDKTQ